MLLFVFSICLFFVVDKYKSFPLMMHQKCFFLLACFGNLCSSYRVPIAPHIHMHLTSLASID